MLKAMILAAGRGTRLSPLTDEIPKPMVPIAGKPMIGHIFELLQGASIGEVHVNVYHLADTILGYYGREIRMNGMQVNVSREDRLMGTAGGVRRLSDHFDETFIVIMGDALTDVDLREVVASHKEHGALATLTLMRVEDTSQYGVVALDSENNIQAFQEKPDPDDAISNLANTGIYVLEPEVLDYIPEDTFFDFANDVFPRLLEAGEKFVGYEGDFYWSDIGTLKAYQAAQRDVFSRKVRVRIPGERWGENLWIDRDAQIHPSATLMGQVVVGRDAIVGSAVTLAEDVMVGDACRIEAEATIKQSILLPGACIGPEARVENCIVGPGYEVRPGEQLREEVLVHQRPRSSQPSPVLSGSKS